MSSLVSSPIIYTDVPWLFVVVASIPEAWLLRKSSGLLRDYYRQRHEPSVLDSRFHCEIRMQNRKFFRGI